MAAFCSNKDTIDIVGSIELVSGSSFWLGDTGWMPTCDGGSGAGASFGCWGVIEARTGRLAVGAGVDAAVLGYSCAPGAGSPPDGAAAARTAACVDAMVGAGAASMAAAALTGVPQSSKSFHGAGC
jgi:hypothetical protein